MTASFFGPLAPLVMWGFDYLYDRRDLVFTTSGTPVQAVAADWSVLPLSALHGITAPQHATLSINTRLTDSARRAGLRNGDPVGVLVTGGSVVQARSGLVVPTRIGERTKITVPNGTYSVTAFGSRRKPCSPSRLLIRWRPAALPPCATAVAHSHCRWCYVNRC